MAAKNATGTIPIVFVTAGDPVDMGLVTSMARPSGNITGLTTHAPELSGKRLELLKEVVPRITRVAVLWNPSNPGFSEILKEMQAASQAHALQLQSLEVRSLEDFEGAFESVTRGDSQAIIVVSDPFLNTHHRLILDLAVKHRLPAMYGGPEVRGCWWLDVLWSRLQRPVPSCRYLRGQDPQRYEAGGAARGAADEVRVSNQSQDREANRPNHSGVCAVSRG